MTLGVTEHTKAISKEACILLAVLVFCITFLILMSFFNAGPLGHDESVYLTKGRAWIEGTPADEYEIYRPVGMAAVAWTLLHFGDSEFVVRIFGVIFGALTMVFTFLLFNRASNWWIALSICLVAGTSLLFLQQAPSFLNDIPSSGLLIGVLWLIYVHYESRGKSWSIYLAGPLAALAFYLRYGTAGALGIILVLSILILLPRLRRDKETDYSKLKTSSIVTILLFLPHFIMSHIVTGKILGILKLAEKAASRKFLGEGLINYVEWLPRDLGGWTLGISAIAGVVVVLILVFNKSLRYKHIHLVWIGSIAIAHLVISGLLTHAEPRYAFFPAVLLSGTGIAGTYFFLQNRSKAFISSLAAMFFLAVIVLGIGSYQTSYLYFRRQEADSGRLAQIKATEVIRNDSGGNCTIWAITSYRPAISWYSECHTNKITDFDNFKKDFIANIRGSHYSIAYSRIKDVQISQKEADSFNLVLTEIFRIDTQTTRGDLMVYKIARKDSEEEDYIKLLEMDNPTSYNSN